MYTFNKLCTIMVTVVLVNNILSTQPKDITVSEYCHIFQNDCKGSDNVCKDFKCQGSHPYLCSSAYCSKNKNSCQRLINMDLVFNAYMKTRIDNFQFLKIYKKLYQSIRNCSVPAYELKAEYLCNNGKNCRIKHFSQLRNSKVSFYVPFECPCPTKYSYRCDSHLCATSKKACDSSKTQSTKKLKNKVNSCGNSNQRL